jgi:hypothetical protein
MKPVPETPIAGASTSANAGSPAIVGTVIPPPPPGSPATGTTSRSDEKLGPVKPEDITLPDWLLPPGPVRDWAAKHRIRAFGWISGGYTWSETGEGLLEVEPRANRFGQNWLLNQAAIVFERTLDPSSFSWGFRSEFYMGADAALLHPVNGFGPSNDRFGTDFRQAYLSVHAPVLTPGGLDLLLGRQYTPLGYETTMAPYRPMYSEAYAWAYSQNGATTGAIATLHVNPDLDIIGGVTLGKNSLFELIGRAPSYIIRVTDWLDPSKRTQFKATVYTGPEPIGEATGHRGKWQTEVEIQLVHDVNQWLTLVSETNFGWDTRDPGNNLRTSWWYGTYVMGIVHVNRLLDVNTRMEWFRDADGSRTGTPTNYGEITIGVNIMPIPALNFRPEIRWDVAGSPVFGPASHALHRNQLTFAFDILLKFGCCPKPGESSSRRSGKWTPSVALDAAMK